MAENVIPPADDFGTPECLKVMWRTISEQCLFLGEMIKAVSETPPAGFPSVRLFLQAIMESGHSYTLLLENNKLRDCMLIARCVVETTINTAFIAATGTATHEKAFRHAVQKGYRDVFRHFSFEHKNMQVGWPSQFVEPTDPFLKGAIQEYTSKKGRELTSWSTEQLEEKLEATKTWLGLKKADTLRFAFFSIYRHASEVAHGTLFSLLHILGELAPTRPRSNEELAQYQREQLTEISFHVGECLNTAILIGAKLIASNETFDNARDLFRERVNSMEWAKNVVLRPDGFPRRNAPSGKESL